MLTCFFSTQELGSVLKGMGVAVTEEKLAVTKFLIDLYLPLFAKIKSVFLQKMIRAADRDGSGSVEFNEFMNMMCKNIEVSKREFCQI